VKARAGASPSEAPAADRIERTTFHARRLESLAVRGRVSLQERT
jgi:hypothetical protein